MKLFGSPLENRESYSREKSVTQFFCIENALNNRPPHLNHFGESPKIHPIKKYGAALEFTQ